MTTEKPDVLAALDRANRVNKLLLSYGSNDQQAFIGSSALADQFTWDGAALTFNETGKIAADDPACREYIAKTYPFLLPPPNVESNGDAAKVEIDPAVIASAKAGNLTAYGKIVRDHGKAKADEAMAALPKDDADAARKAKADTDRKNNPWSKAGWSITKQGQLVKSLGLEKAAGIAAAVNSRVGATRPTQ